MKLKKVNGRAPVIMQVLPNLQQGGVERGTVDAAKAIIKAGGTAIVVSNGGKLANEVMIAKATHITLPVHTKNIFKIFKNAKKLAKIIKEYDVDIVHARSRAPAYSCYIACKRTKTKLVTTFHAPYAYKSRLKRFYNSIMAKGDEVIAISNYVKEYINKGYHIPNYRINLVVRGTDMEKFDPKKVTDEKIAEMLNTWNIPEGNPIVLCAGRLTKWKGQETLIDAAKVLLDKGIKDVTYVFMGSDQGRTEYSSMLFNKINELGLDKNFYMIPGTTEMPTLYRISDIVVCSSTEPEGFGRIPTEAGAMGRPVIATALGGHLETVIDGETGSLIPPADSQALAEAIEKHLKMPARAKTTLAKKARQNVEDNFSTEVMFKSLFSIYNKLLKG